jgi:hypothetical protein
MGQQQLLLIVLGVIVVGIAVVVGINLFNANAVSSNRDAVISDLNNLGAMAQQFYKKPQSMGGGGNTFNTGGITGSGWTIPDQLVTTANGHYVVTATGGQSITIQGTGTELNGADSVQANCTVTPTSVTVQVVH